MDRLCRRVRTTRAESPATEVTALAQVLRENFEVEQSAAIVEEDLVSAAICSTTPQRACKDKRNKMCPGASCFRKFQVEFRSFSIVHR